MFIGSEIPQFRQGEPVHELEVLVTAKDCNYWTEKVVARTRRD